MDLEVHFRKLLNLLKTLKLNEQKCLWLEKVGLTPKVLTFTLTRSIPLGLQIAAWLSPNSFFTAHITDGLEDLSSVFPSRHLKLRGLCAMSHENTRSRERRKESYNINTNN